VAKDKKYKSEKDRFDRFETQRQELFKINELQEIGVNNLQDIIYFELARRYGITGAFGIISFKDDKFELESMIDRIVTNISEGTKWELDRLNESENGTSLLFSEYSKYIINSPKFKEFADFVLNSIGVPFDTIQELYDGLHSGKTIDYFKEDIDGTNLQGLSSLQWADDVYQSIFHKYGKTFGLPSNTYGNELINRNLVKSLKLNLDKGSPFLEEEKESGPLNSGANAATAPSGTSINPSAGEKAASAEASTVNPVKSTPTETAVEKTTGTVTASQPSIPKEAATPAPNTEVNVSITPPAATSPITPTVGSAPALAASTVSPITPTAGSALAPAAQSASPLNGTPVTAEPATASIIGTSTVNSTTNVSNLTENKKVEGSVGPVTEVKTTSQTLNSPTTTNTTVGATSESTINQAKTETTVDAKKAPDTTINSAKSTNTATSLVGQSSQSSLFNKYFKSILSPEDKKPAEPVTENSGTTESLPATAEPAAEVTQTKVSKTPPSFPEKIQPSSEKIIEKANTKVLEKTQEMMNQKELIKSEEKTEYAAPISVTESKGSTPDAGTSDSSKPAAGTSMAGVEARLARLEYLLSNPLEVKIIE
jgi:hypothetical protein